MITDGNPITSVNRADKRRPLPPPPPPRHLRGLRTPLLDRPFTFASRLPPLTPTRPRESLLGGGVGQEVPSAPPAQPLGAVSIPSLPLSHLSPSAPLSPCPFPFPSLPLSLSPAPALSLSLSSWLFLHQLGSLLPLVSLSSLPRESSAVSCCYALRLWLRLWYDRHLDSERWGQAKR